MPYGRFDRDVDAAMAQVGVRLNARPAYVDDETVIRMVGRGLGVTMMSELMIRGRTDDVLCVPVTPRSIRELGMGLPPGGHAGPVALLRDCVTAFIKTVR